MPLSSGSIAFVGFNADGVDGFAFVAVDAIAGGTQILFTDNSWNGTSFTANEQTYTWTAPAAGIAPGTVIEISGVNVGNTLNVVSGGGTIVQSGGAAIGRGFNSTDEAVYAYTGTAAAPNFLTAAASNGFDNQTAGALISGTLTGTGLVEGATAINIGGSADVGAYVGPRDFSTDRTAALSSLNNAANWERQSATGDQSADGTGPDAPFNATPFVICYFAGTMIATPGGPRAVETLAEGDLVLTHEGHPCPVLWIGRQTIVPRFQDPARVLPIRIAAGALDEGLPVRDLLLSPGHAILLDGILLNAGALVNGSSIRRETNVPERFHYWHVETEAHSLILAEGVVAETFMDNDTRRHFDNHADYEQRFGSVRAVGDERPEPRALSARQVPPAIRARIAARAHVQPLRKAS